MEYYWKLETQLLHWKHLIGPVFLVKLFHFIPEFINTDCSLVICYADLYRGHKPNIIASNSIMFAFTVKFLLHITNHHQPMHIGQRIGKHAVFYEQYKNL